MRIRTQLSLCALLLCTLSASLYGQAAAHAKPASQKTAAVLKSRVSAEGQACMDCHKATTPGMVSEWQHSEHAKQGVDCYGCHKANPGDPAAFDHNGFKIAVLVTPRYCARCHAKETEQFENSRHAHAATFIGSLDNTLGEIVEGAPIVQSGCRQCHGSTVQLAGPGQMTSSSWPNSGVGRVNPDGSLGSCSACHARHSFSAAQARQPENCGRCHMGPDHPQKEIYEESMHGIIYRANLDKMNLNSKTWVVGKDYTKAPTCVTCHMGGTPDHPEVTHDVGSRLSWTLRPAVSIHQPEWEKKREGMREVCASCHASGMIDNFYKQYDDSVTFYNTKYGEPAAAIMKTLAENRKISSTPFDSQLKWDYYEMWHHQGRAARMGASMQGPDYTQWHGFYEVAKTFYLNFLPEAEKLMPGVTKSVTDAPENQWIKGLSREQIKEQLDYYKQRYNQ
jgi:hypothetical protein